MEYGKFTILLADDDDDDCMFFKDALEELFLPVLLTIVNDGAELIRFLESNSADLPSMIFLDLNMPRKSGIECLSEIKKNEKTQPLPVIIYSTSSNPDVIDLLYDSGAQYYIRKPADFINLKNVINKAILLIKQNSNHRPPKEKFIIQP